VFVLLWLGVKFIAKPDERLGSVKKNKVNILEIKLNPKWFKLKIVARRAKRGKHETHYAYVSGENLYFVKFDTQQALGLDWLVYVKEIQYDDIIAELNRRRGYVKVCRNP
jgi:hypothetical protein